MLKDITWQQYLIAILISGALYYTIVLLRFYRIEFIAIFHRKPDWQDTSVPEQKEYPSILGEIEQEPQNALILSEDLQFAPDTDRNETEEN